MLTERVPDWRSRLISTISNLSGRKLKYGEHDCVTFCFDIIKELTGKDLIEDIRGTYGPDAKSVKLALQKHGKGSLSKAVSYHVQEYLRSIPISSVEQGDLVYSSKAPIRSSGSKSKKKHRGPNIGICVGIYAVYLADDVVYDDIQNIERAWAVGR